ncbi:Kae1-associated serine/threonine protein kinase [Candidatus Woesearchaeota archaeon]|nr:Kae1-associated serine/threonine protein kinase [Candidatus Woesearchaeota archaeon]
MKQIAQGAEAILYENKLTVLKIRPKKNYRIAEIDDAIRKGRTKREIKILEKLKSEGICVPRIIKSADFEIIMERVNGKKLRDVLDKHVEYAKELGKIVGKMHAVGIIHGDLTTSNVLVEKGKLWLIDFGLSYFSAKDEDRAVDLHVFHQALESSHYSICSDVLKLFYAGYKCSFSGAKNVLQRLNIVGMRGRYKKKTNVYKATRS